jgi:hypothetical protein
MGSPIGSKDDPRRRQIGSLSQDGRLLSVMMKKFVSRALISDLWVLRNLSGVLVNSHKERWDVTGLRLQCIQYLMVIPMGVLTRSEQ